MEAEGCMFRLALLKGGKETMITDGTQSRKGKIREFLVRNPHFPYTAPAMTAMILLTAVPFIAVILLSFTNYELAMPLSNFKWIGLRNYDRLLFGTNKLLYYSLGISVGMMVIATVFQMVLGFISASLLNQDIKFRGLAIACLLVPIAMTPSIASQVWKLMLNSEFGVINYFLKNLFNTSVVWLDKDNSLLSVLLVNIWIMTPYVTLTLYAGLRSLPLEPYESAMLDGANRRQALWYITLPLLKPLILLVGVISVLLIRVMNRTEER